MKTIKWTGLLCMALMLSNHLIAQDKQQLTVPLSEPGKPYKLNVDLVSGSIKVAAYDGKEVIIDIESQQRSRRDDRETKSGMKRIIGADNVDVTAQEKSNVVTIGTNMPNKNIALTIKVPQGASSLKLSTVNNGIITVSDVSSEMELSNINGAIKLSNVSGSVVANTVNGAIVVTFKAVDPKAAMAFTSLNGTVDVTFPASLKANFKLRSDQGNIYSDFDMVTDKSPAKATKTAKDGMYRITIEDWVYGKINGGGPEILMKNMNGNILIRKAK